MLRRSLTPLLFLGLAACGTKAPVTPEPTPTPTPSPSPSPVDPCSIDPRSVACRGEPPPFTGTHPIDAIMHRVFWLEGHTPTLASTQELCRRLFVDLIGRSPTEAEVRSTCQGKEADAIITSLMAQDGYLWRSASTWRDRLDSNDVMSDWRYQKALYARIVELHRGRLRYDDFAVEALSSPGMTGLDIQPDARVRRAFRVFLGRAATEAEAVDLSGLVQPFLIEQVRDPDFPYLYRFRSIVIPALCQPLFRCEAKLFGGGALDLASWGTDVLAWEDLDAGRRRTLSEFGRLVVRQPIFWEAEADEILSRLLGWSDGGRFPREPGILLPEVRQALAERLAETGDVPAAERLVLTSILYRQAAEQASDGLGDAPDAPVPPPYLSGPVKAMRAEDWLDSLSNLSVPFGGCDPRYPDIFSFVQMIQAAETGTITAERYAADVLRLRELTELRMPLFDDPGSGRTIPDYRYASVARIIGGCPGFQSRRVSADSMSFAFSQESVAQLLCNPAIAFRATPLGATGPEGVLDHQMKLLFGRGASAAERAAITTAHAGCSGADCDGDGESLCVALSASAEGFFY